MARRSSNKDSDVFAELRMYRKGAVTGRVLDENGIGTQDIPVIAYRARLPLRAVGRAILDDRGVYRIFGLDPGKVWVRTVAHTLDDGSGLLPTFGREGRDISESHVQTIRLDEDALDADVWPFAGRLFSCADVRCAMPAGHGDAVERNRTSQRAIAMYGYIFVRRSLAGAV